MTILHFAVYEWGEELPVVLVPDCSLESPGIFKHTMHGPNLRDVGSVGLELWF